MEKARSENEKLDLEFSVSGVSTQNYLSFIQFLDASVSWYFDDLIMRNDTLRIKMMKLLRV